MYVAKDLIGLYYETDIALAMLVIAYLIMLLPISLIFSWIERRLRHAGFGNASTLSGK
ncbi:Polar amino acid ABC uptake transporter membrane-spanning protein [Streptococcus oralis]|uniref:Polar amino acid ABC uptake transporter membrane-spanning protein n=1 Tax=Streptococcus oralis TaxID=1303 RepID=A0A139RMB1_STROR|nr:Polar amino acid ABC uptake transporter membrane-spanning protein [Streptococcus oralis]